MIIIIIFLTRREKYRYSGENSKHRDRRRGENMILRNITSTPYTWTRARALTLPKRNTSDAKPTATRDDRPSRTETPSPAKEKKTLVRRALGVRFGGNSPIPLRPAAANRNPNPHPPPPPLHHDQTSFGGARWSFRGSCCVSPRTRIAVASVRQK